MISTRPLIAINSTRKVRKLGKKILLEAPGPFTRSEICSKPRPIFETSDELSVLIIGRGLRIGLRASCQSKMFEGPGTGVARGKHCRCEELADFLDKACC